MDVSAVFVRPVSSRGQCWDPARGLLPPEAASAAPGLPGLGANSESLAGFRAFRESGIVELCQVLERDFSMRAKSHSCDVSKFMVSASEWLPSRVFRA